MIDDGRPFARPTMPNILVVDDDILVLTLAAHFLDRSGFSRVTVCSSVEKARSHLARGVFDLVISDVQMVPEDGLSLLRWIRGDPRYGRMPVILMTASLGRRIRDDAHRAGVDAFLTKPFDRPTLSATIDRVLARADTGGVAHLRPMAAQPASSDGPRHHGPHAAGPRTAGEPGRRRLIVSS